MTNKTINKDATFFDALKDEEVRSDLGYTENGALAYNTTGSALLDFDFNTSSVRAKTPAEIAEDFTKAFYENKELAMRYMFFMGDIREGKGERHAFNSLLTFLDKEKPELLADVLDLIPEYGRWDEVVNLIDGNCGEAALKLIKDQLEEDLDSEHPSLLGKWLPSINASSDETRRKAHKILKYLGYDYKTYRKTLSGLRDKLNVVEKALAEKDTKKLDEMQESLTSKQNFKYSKALMRNIPEERKKYFERVLKGEANFNVNVLEPHEIYYRYRTESSSSYRHVAEDLSYEAMWKMLPNKVQDGKGVLVVRDGSGSMTCGIPGTNKGEILDVASALTVYFAEHAQGGFHDKFITFSSRPQVIDLSGCDTLADKMNYLYRFNDCSNTDVKSVFDLVLKTAKNNNMSQEELPNSILIVSDMQFDSALEGGLNETLFDTIRKEYEEAGYKLPRLIFWNVDSRGTTIPVIKNELGLVLLSGYSKNIMDMICADEFEKEVVKEDGTVEKVQLSPLEILVNKVMSERYDAVSDAIAETLDKEQKMKVKPQTQSNDER